MTHRNHQNSAQLVFLSQTWKKTAWVPPGSGLTIVPMRNRLLHFCRGAVASRTNPTHRMLLAWLVLLCLTLTSMAGHGAIPVIVSPPAASANETLAAREIQRYLYLRTGRLCPIVIAERSPAIAAILVARRDRPLLATPTLEPETRTRLDALAPQAFLLKTVPATGGSSSLVIAGGDDQGTLYGAYRFAERLGVRFNVDGDVLPDQQIPLNLAGFDEPGQPLFGLRGLLPFHDFPEGPDWWTLDEWKSVLSQTAKMRMNFVGLHTYPKGDLGPEPTVWIGQPQDVHADGTVAISDSTSWHNTQRYSEYGCYRPEKTSAFSFGGSTIFESDDYGAEVNNPDDFPFPKTTDASVALVNRTGAMLREAFTFARGLGIKTCVGTEGPLNIPEAIKNRLIERGLNPTNNAVVQQLYEGVFTRIQRSYPLDYYWIWGHEGEINPGHFLADFQAALAAAKSVKSSFGLGLCGWGWITDNFPALDPALPKDVVFSAISMSVGNSPVSPNFSKLGTRPRWAIPWFEDDPGLITPQLWVGRMRQDAVDARKYGCTGLMGLHWRTRVLGPNISALAQAGWDQAGWSQPPTIAPARTNDVEVLGGQTASFLNNAIGGTDQAPLYQDVRFNLDGYKLALPNGRYTITLKFCEPAYSAAGKRVFGVKLQDQLVIEHLDVFARVGQNTALDLSYTGVAVTDGHLRIDFVKEVEFPFIAAFAAQNERGARKVNCGGPAYQDYDADPGPVQTPRFLPTLDFYTDWATAQFGAEAGPRAAALFARLDGHFPRPCDWNRGPGVIAVNPQPWSKVEPAYRFVEEFASYRPQVTGPAAQERFHWWLETFRYTRAMARLGCARGELDRVIAAIGKTSDPQARRQRARQEALPLRLELVPLLGELYRHLLATLHNTSEMGMVVNVEQQALLRTQLLTVHDRLLTDWLGEALPPAAAPWHDYRGPDRIVVPTRRSSLEPREALKLKVIILAATPPKTAALHWRTLGRGSYATIPLSLVNRSVYSGVLPANATTEALEYYVQTTTAGGNILRYPASAPHLNLTAVVQPPAVAR